MVSGWRAGLLGMLLGTVPALAQAQNFCVYDPVGAQGQAFAIAKDYALAARAWGVNLTLQAYTDDRVAAEDFKAGQCDGVAITGLRGRAFNLFAGSVDSIGAIPSYAHLRAVLEVMASPKVADLMRSGAYEVVGVMPLGAAYVFVRDRGINSIEKIAGKKIAVLDFDKSQAKLVQQLGAQPVASELINFATKFNNGQVDLIVAPAIAYKPFEIYKGLADNGAVYRFPLLQLTASMIIRRDRFPVSYGQQSREYMLSQVDAAQRLIEQAESGIPDRYWLELAATDREKYFQMLREARMQLTREGFYDPRMMNMLRKVRCRLQPAQAECAVSVE